MPTVAQIRANRLNAQRSTGPRTPSGKATVAQNARKHGLLARAVLLPDDGATATRALAALATSLHTELKPHGPVEHALVDRIVASLWRLRRAAHVESGIFASQLCEERVSAAAREAQLASQGETWVDDLQRRHAPLVSAGVVQVADGTRYRAALTAARCAELSATRDARVARRASPDPHGDGHCCRRNCARGQPKWTGVKVSSRFGGVRAMVGEARPSP